MTENILPTTQLIVSSYSVTDLEFQRLIEFYFRNLEYNALIGEERKVISSEGFYLIDTEYELAGKHLMRSPLTE